MSYNTQLQSINTDLQAILDAVNALPEATNGVELPELTNEATAVDMLSGKELIDQEGNIVTGTMKNNGSITATFDGLDTKSYTIPVGYTSGGTVSLDNTIDTEVSEQADLISQIKVAVDELPEAEENETGNAGSDSSDSSIETCTINIVYNGPSDGINFYYTDENMNFQQAESPVSLVIAKNTIVAITAWTSGSTCSDGIEEIFYTQGNAAFKITNAGTLYYET